MENHEADDAVIFLMPFAAPAPATLLLRGSPSDCSWRNPPQSRPRWGSSLGISLSLEGLLPSGELAKAMPLPCKAQTSQQGVPGPHPTNPAPKGAPSCYLYCVNRDSWRTCLPCYQGRSLLNKINDHISLNLFLSFTIKVSLRKTHCHLDPDIPLRRGHGPSSETLTY